MQLIDPPCEMMKVNEQKCSSQTLSKRNQHITEHKTA